MHLNIVDPGAGIVFGYEPWQLELRNGVAVGVISSETADEITLKTPGGVVIRHNRADVLSVTRLPASLMPEGLLDSLDNQEVADLLEYLASLRAVPAAGR
jgi:putative heme-binding domain-containing protein